MFWRSFPFVKEAALCAATFLLTASLATAGEHVRASRSTTPSPPASAPVARVTAQPMTFSVAVMTPAQPAPESAYVDLVGPDGQKRRFPVEGGLASIQYRRVVLRPGEMLVINWTPTK